MPAPSIQEPPRAPVSQITHKARYWQELHAVTRKAGNSACRFFGPAAPDPV
jgi:hypothetical protein